MAIATGGVSKSTTITLHFGMDTYIAEPAADRGERQDKNLKKIETGSPSNTAGQCKEFPQPAGREHHRQHQQREWEKPLDPMLHDEFIGRLEDVERGIMSDLIDDLRGRVQKKKHQQQKRRGKKLAVRVGLGAHIESIVGSQRTNPTPITSQK